MEEISKNSNNGRLKGSENIDIQAKRNFSLTNINFEKIHKNLDNVRKERKEESHKEKLDTKDIILDLKYQMRTDFYKLIDTYDKKKINNNDKNPENGIILGKKRKSDIPIIDIIHTSLKKE